ncbi:toprim domain-containing protein [Ruficoccus amylovorans]|uniref:Toprim domain-containing protein n=1 Tax=Ruficoccus amylovorans TaxID=1804625 RepID=A0A842HBS8_9BACT|nr:CHC2 zinc finger domain-containing protein [Ruficoccus amylovorans]MBC2593528.1 toprim domain-containing protein [Ruficoccus amylovorans]
MSYHEREELDRLKDRVSLSDYLANVGIELKPAGHLLRAHCPLHEDATPSFYVWDDNSFYCYGCQTGGDVFTLTQKLYDLSFSDAVDRVREYAGGSNPLPAPVRTVLPTARKALRETDQSLLERVVNSYQSKLQGSDAALAYLHKRKISDSVVERFSLGYASGYLAQSMPAEIDHLLKLGLMRKQGSDTYYGRVTVPVYDVSGKVSQLYGRSLGDANKHRYLPFPHTTLFHPDALNESRIILCESILDALTLHSYSFDNTLSVYGARGLKGRFVEQIAEAGVRKVMLAYDADKAGDEGASKAAGLLRKRGILSYRLQLPEGMDVNSVAMESEDPGNELNRLVRDSRHNRI